MNKWQLLRVIRDKQHTDINPNPNHNGLYEYETLPIMGGKILESIYGFMYSGNHRLIKDIPTYDIVSCIRTNYTFFASLSLLNIGEKDVNKERNIPICEFEQICMKLIAINEYLRHGRHIHTVLNTHYGMTQPLKTRTN